MLRSCGGNAYKDNGINEKRNNDRIAPVFAKSMQRR